MTASPAESELIVQSRSLPNWKFVTHTHCSLVRTQASLAANLRKGPVALHWILGPFDIPTRPVTQPPPLPSTGRSDPRVVGGLRAVVHAKTCAR